MRHNQKREDLQARAEALEDRAVAVAEAGPYYTVEQPNRGKTEIAHAELCLRVAELLRERATGYL